MGAPIAPITVTGQAETIAALNAVGDFDKVRAANQAAQNLIPYVAANTRVLSGLLQASWVASDEYISNEQDYAVVQEFGSIYVAPTGAIGRAAAMHEEALTDGYSEVITDAAEQAGFVDI